MHEHVQSYYLHSCQKSGQAIACMGSLGASTYHYGGLFIILGDDDDDWGGKGNHFHLVFCRLHCHLQ